MNGFFRSLMNVFDEHGHSTQKLLVQGCTISRDREPTECWTRSVVRSSVLEFMQAEQTRPASGRSLQGQGEVERLNQKTVFEVKTVCPGALSPGIEVEFLAALAARKLDEPSQHFTAEPATARRLARDQ